MSFIVLHSISPEKGRSRYYTLTCGVPLPWRWQPSLVAGWVVERAWGPLRSSRRQRRTVQVEGLEQARLLVSRHLKRRLRHDYHLVDSDPGGQDLFDRVRG